MLHKVGLISDTHGLLRSQAKKLLQDCDLILHAGDVDKPQVLEELNQIAPTTAVRGNMDFEAWANRLNYTERIKVGNWSIIMVHNVHDLPKLDDEVDIVIFGHSHQFFFETKDDVLFINPGSAGPRRFTLPISMAILTLGKEAHLEQIILKEKA